MDCKTLAETFVTSFCSGNIEGIDAVLSSQFKLKGPLYQFDSKHAYIDSLRGNLEADPNASIMSILGNEDEATVFFIYSGNTIGQLFKSREGKIHETLLIFDTSNMDL